jgi:hypothetical protein
MTGWWLALVIDVAAPVGLVWQARQGRVRAAARVGPQTLPEPALHRVDAVAAVTLLTTPDLRAVPAGPGPAG